MATKDDTTQRLFREHARATTSEPDRRLTVLFEDIRECFEQHCPTEGDKEVLISNLRGEIW